MATIKYINERIESLSKQIEKKIALIDKMQVRIDKNRIKLEKLGLTQTQIAVGIDNPWRLDDNMPNASKAFDICYTIHNAMESVKNAQDALVDLKPQLAKWQKDLETEIEKANSRNVTAILEFLEGWKQRVTDHYMKELANYYTDKAAVKEAVAKAWDHRLPYGSDERKQAMELAGKLQVKFNEDCHGVFETVEYTDFYGRKRTKKNKVKYGKYEYLSPYNRRSTLEGALADLKEDLDREAERKYDFIIERTNEIVGTITDATGLYVGNKHELNGYIIGTRGRAHVQTIGAGGYNIQCFHFRTLIHEA